MADRTPRPSADEEHAPLLQDRDDRGERPQTWNDQVNSYAQEPLTPLTKILLILGLILLLTTSVFIGLFAGAQHRLKLERDGKKSPNGTETVTFTNTVSSTVSQTVTATTTAITTATTTKTTIRTTTKVCLQPHCIVLSANILSSLDVSQDPCDNFYDFVNGGWLKSHPLPADKGSFGSFEALQKQNQQLIQQILETNDITSPDPYDRELLHKLRDFYSSCLNEDALNKIGITPLSDFVKTVRNLYQGKSTEISSTATGSAGLTAAIAYLHSRGIGALFSFGIEGDVGVDPNAMTLWFSQPEFGLPSKEYFEEDDIREVYTSVIERLLSTVMDGTDAEALPTQPVVVQSQADNAWPPRPWPPWEGDDGEDDDDKPKNNRSKAIRQLAGKVVDFERKLALASLDLDILYGDPIATYNPVPLSNLTGTITQIHFPTYFSTFTPRTYPNRLILTDPSYPVSLSKILRNADPKVIEAYLVSRAALSLSPYLGMNTEAWRAQRTLVETLTGIKKGAVGDRAEYCVARTEEVLGFASGKYFVEKTFAGDSRRKATQVIKDIITAFKKSLKGLDWMDEKSATAAAEKADALHVKVGYPTSPDTRDARSLARYYSGVKIDKNKFFANMLSSAAAEQFRNWLQLGRRRNQEAWEMYPSTVNAYYNPPANEIVFPAGILQDPFFAQDWPHYLVYGPFGHVAAHELTHAFDSAGRLYNQEGKLAEWWTNATSAGFQVKQDCIVEQYSAYAIDDGKGGKIHVNGNLTATENIGDTGLVQAYRAWQAQYDTSEKDGTEYLLPGLDFTRDQLFFISFARVWARAIKPAAAVQRIRTDPHSPTRFRVDGTVSNMPQFAKAFKCPAGAKLNPPQEKRCIFWG